MHTGEKTNIKNKEENQTYDAIIEEWTVDYETVERKPQERIEIELPKLTSYIDDGQIREMATLMEKLTNTPTHRIFQLRKIMYEKELECRKSEAAMSKLTEKCTENGKLQQRIVNLFREHGENIKELKTLQEKHDIERNRTLRYAEIMNDIEQTLCKNASYMIDDDAHQLAMSPAAMRTMTPEKVVSVMETKYNAIIANIHQMNLEKESKETEIETLQERLHHTEDELNQTQSYLQDLFGQYKEMNASYQSLQRSMHQQQTSSILKENTSPYQQQATPYQRLTTASSPPKRVTPRNLIHDI